MNFIVALILTNQQKAAMSFSLENFVAAPSMELLNLAKKTDLLNIADHYALTPVKSSMLIHESFWLMRKFSTHLL